MKETNLQKCTTKSLKPTEIKIDYITLIELGASYVVLINTLTLTGWKVVQRDVDLHYDIETAPLELQTDSVLGSGDYVWVYFKDSQGNWAGGVFVKFTSTPQYYIGWCNGWFNFPTPLPTATVKVWRITVIKSSDIVSVQIHCNGEEVLNYVLSDSTCRYDWTTYWRRDGVQIYFNPSYNTASDYYRPFSLGNYKSNENCVLSSR